MEIARQSPDWLTQKELKRCAEEEEEKSALLAHLKAKEAALFRSLVLARLEIQVKPAHRFHR